MVFTVCSWTWTRLACTLTVSHPIGRSANKQGSMRTRFVMSNASRTMTTAITLGASRAAACDMCAAVLLLAF
ncbi:hypothetical protein CBR_g4758 [Chara braunii]|uniref:Secreted protein n=1 Tax=Chara braunii TaxID=69332 RepID=A0A388KIY8_CHABU|nr:hypothetical protein CBR_g4758 [Chara braunii]|eukprot:GBG69933.1 hypothetical protein CBR_g4758 [Chara braunii]